MLQPVIEDVRLTLWRGGKEETDAYDGLKKGKGILLKQNSNIFSVTAI